MIENVIYHKLETVRPESALNSTNTVNNFAKNTSLNLIDNMFEVNNFYETMLDTLELENLRYSRPLPL